MAGWTTPADVERTIRRRWDSGALLRQYGAGADWEPWGLPLRGPTAGELAADLGRVQDWVRSWERAAPRWGRLEYRRVGGRLIGVNQLPAKLWIDSYRQLCSALDVRADADRFAELVAATGAEAPPLVEWMLRHPLRVLELAADWRLLVAAVRGIDRLPDRRVYLRQIDVPGVDTKFIDRHRSTLAALLDLHLDPATIDQERPRSEFVERYGFRPRPRYARLRTLDDDQRLAGGFTELTVRLAELATAPPDAGTVYVIENEITYLAFPPVADAVALLGGGYAVGMLEPLAWLADRDLVYWGDIDTHGLAILDRLRSRFPHARSLLMDRATLLAHERQWVHEKIPHTGPLDRLHPAEADLYRDLVAGVFGPGVRLEQERISYAAVARAAAVAALRVAASRSDR